MNYKERLLNMSVLMPMQVLLKYALSKNFFTEEEVRLFKRGRNCKGHSVKNKSVVVHNQSSGFESMIGHLYLTKQTER